MPLDKGIYFCIKYYLYIIYLLYGWGKLVSSIQVQQGAKITPVPFEAGETLLSALRRAGYSIPAACGGKGRCGKCRVKVNGVPRLACKTKAQDGDWIDLPETMRGVILTDTLTLPKAQAGRSGLGAAVDLGTTTVALRLFDRADGKLLAQAQDWNAQAPYGADVISRIQHTMEASDGLGELSRCIRAQTETLLERTLSAAGRKTDEVKELIIAGAGDMQLSVLMAKLQSKYKVEAVLKPAKIAYRETIKKKVEIHGRHKKQSGGHGQFGDVYIRFEPQSESEEMIFADETVGGCVPKNFIPSVEKGLRNCVGKGVLAGYPVVFLKSTLYFGSYHPVDSSDMAFQTAAGIAYKEGLPTAGPTLLEPIGELKVLVPDSNMGDIIGDLNKRRGRVMGMNPDAENPGYQTVEAEVPMGEMSSYTIDLRAMTQGRGSYSLKFVRYEEVPQMNQAKIIEDAKKDEEEG